MIEVSGKGEPRGIWKESCGGLWGRDGRLWRRGVGVGRWAGKHARLVGGVVSKHRLLMGGWRALREEFLASGSRKKKKDCLSSLWYHRSRGPGLAVQSLHS